MKYTSQAQHCCDVTIDDRMVLNCEQWDNSNVTKDLFGIVFDMLFSELCKIVVIKVIFVGFRWGWSPQSPPPWIRPWFHHCFIRPIRALLLNDLAQHLDCAESLLLWSRDFAQLKQSARFEVPAGLFWTTAVLKKGPKSPNNLMTQQVTGQMGRSNKPHPTVTNFVHAHSTSKLWQWLSCRQANQQKFLTFSVMSSQKEMEMD